MGSRESTSVSVDILLVDYGYKMNVRDTSKLIDLPEHHVEHDVKEISKK